MNYHVVFDAAQNGGQVAFFFLIPPLFALLLGVIGWALTNCEEDSRLIEKGKIFMIISGIGFAGCIFLALSCYSEYRQARKALETGDYQSAEGIVTDFIPMPPGGHSIESFKIGLASFEYGSGWGSIVFNSEWNHGYIHNGSHVRIAYRNGEILRVEVIEAR